MRHWLFVCSRNRLRSSAAEAMFGRLPDVGTASAGTSPDADNPLTGELIEWSDAVFVMERVHRTRVQRRFRRHLDGKRVVCLDILDDYACMDPALMASLTKRMARMTGSKNGVTASHGGSGAGKKNVGYRPDMAVQSGDPGSR